MTPTTAESISKDQEVVARIREYREDLEALAESDNPAATIAQNLLDAADVASSTEGRDVNLNN